MLEFNLIFVNITAPGSLAVNVLFCMPSLVASGYLRCRFRHDITMVNMCAGNSITINYTLFSMETSDV